MYHAYDPGSGEIAAVSEASDQQVAAWQGQGLTVVEGPPLSDPAHYKYVEGVLTARDAGELTEVAREEKQAQATALALALLASHQDPAEQLICLIDGIEEARTGTAPLDLYGPLRTWVIQLRQNLINARGQIDAAPDPAGISEEQITAWLEDRLSA